MSAIRFAAAYDAIMNLYPSAPPAKVAALAFVEAAPDFSPGLGAYLRQHGIALADALAIAGPIVVADVRFGGRVFSFDDVGGEPAAVMIVHADDGETVLDLFAWSLADPGRFLTYGGEAAILGRLTGFPGQPVELHRDPLDWLRSGGAGAVVISAQRARSLFASAPGPFFVADPQHGRSLVRDLKPALTADRVLITRRSAA